MVRQYEYQPCIPTRGTKVPAGPDWLHEIKHDGFRMIVQREGKRRTAAYKARGPHMPEFLERGMVL